MDFDEFVTACGLAEDAIDLHIYLNTDYFCPRVVYELDLNWVNTETDKVYDFGHGSTVFENYEDARETASKMKALFVLKDMELDETQWIGKMDKDTDYHDFTTNGRFDWRRWAYTKIMEQNK